MRHLIAGLAVLAAGCAAPTEETTYRQKPPVLEEPLPASLPYAMPTEEVALLKSGYPDIYLHIQDWREAVLDHADRATLIHLRNVSSRRIRALEERDAELAARPPFIVYDARRCLFELISLETERLGLIETAIESSR